MATLFRRYFLVAGLLLGLVFIPSALSFTLTGGRLVEDFSTDDFADYTNTTGLWNIMDHQAQAGAVANGDPTRPITFGDGSDGTVDTGGGYAFNTDSHPNGYNFKSLNITGGAVTVTGSRSLVIRSLTGITITPTITIAGTAGNNGTANASNNGPSGGAATAGACFGARGGNATAVLPQAGGNSILFDGSVEAGTGGAPNAVLGANDASGAGTPVTGGPGNLDAANGFVCGTSGAGGGGQGSGAVNFATGGAGGSGGGAIRIASVGSLTVGTINANGGAGGLGLNDGSACSGHGGGGQGGAIWLQSLKSVTATDVNITVGFGLGGTGNGCVGAGVAGGDGTNGVKRCDSPLNPGAPNIACPFTTTNAAPGASYIIQSKGYDLGTLNVVFKSPVINSVSNGGGVSVSYAGSVDGKSYSAFTTDITTLNNQSYRYFKFQIGIRAAGVAGPSPVVTQLAFDYSDAGLDKLDLKLSPGCGTIQDAGRSNPRSNMIGMVLCAFWLSLWMLGFRVSKRLLH